LGCWDFPGGFPRKTLINFLSYSQFKGLERGLLGKKRGFLNLPLGWIYFRVNRGQKKGFVLGFLTRPGFGFFIFWGGTSPRLFWGGITLRLARCLFFYPFQRAQPFIFRGFLATRFWWGPLLYLGAPNFGGRPLFLFFRGGNQF